MIQRLFTEQKQEDAVRTPSFERVIHHERHPPVRREQPLRLVATVAALAAVVLVMMALSASERNRQLARAAEQQAHARALEAAEAMWGWESPTDFLIEDSDQDWMHELPTLREPSLLTPFDDESSTSTKTEGTTS
jgi:hypothetical protein